MILRWPGIGLGTVVEVVPSVKSRRCVFVLFLAPSLKVFQARQGYHTVDAKGYALLAAWGGFLVGFNSMPVTTTPHKAFYVPKVLWLTSVVDKMSSVANSCTPLLLLVASV